MRSRTNKVDGLSLGLAKFVADLLNALVAVPKVMVPSLKPLRGSSSMQAKD